MKPRILISGTAGQMKHYVSAVRAAEGDCFARYAPTLGAEHFDALLLCGGGDIEPALFGAADSGLNRGVDHRRERSDLALIPAFLARRKPVFGVCRGMQMINVALGGTLLQDLGEKNAVHEGTETGDRIHSVTAGDSALRQIYGARFPVNSCHHQAVLAPAPGMRVVSRAEDGTIEALEHETLPVFGVQWHPERLCLEFARSGAVDGLELFRYFVGLCRRWG